MKRWSMVLMGVFALGTLSLVARAADDDDPKYEIKDVMKKAMKGGLCKKVAGGNGSAEDAKELLAMFKDLAKADPPMGDKESWKKKTKALVDGAQAMVDGKADAGKMLQKAANCKACHGEHKPA